MCILRGGVFPPTLGGTVWRRHVPPDVNIWSNRTEELSSLFPPYIRYKSIICGFTNYCAMAGKNLRPRQRLNVATVVRYHIIGLSSLQLICLRNCTEVHFARFHNGLHKGCSCTA